MRRILILVVPIVAVTFVVIFLAVCICWPISTSNKRKLAAAMIEFNRQAATNSYFHQILPNSLSERDRRYYQPALTNPFYDVKPGYMTISYCYRRFGVDYEQEFTIYHRRPDDLTWTFARSHPDDPIWTLFSDTRTWLWGDWRYLREQPIAVTNVP